MIHHPPVRGAVSQHKRLFGISRFHKIVRRHGAELVLHGHSHLPSLFWIGARGAKVPVVGVAAAGQAPGGKHPAAQYNLFDIDGEKGDWRIRLTRRGLTGPAITAVRICRRWNLASEAGAVYGRKLSPIATMRSQNRATDTARPTSAPAAIRPRPDRKADQPLLRVADAQRRLGFRHAGAFHAGDSRLDPAFHHPLALDDALGDIARHLIGDRLHLGRFGQHHAADAGVLEEAVGAAVAPHRDMADGVDPQARLQARGNDEVEIVHVGGHVGEDRREFGGQQIETHAMRLAHVDDDIVAVGEGVLHVADGIGQLSLDGSIFSPASFIGVCLAGLVNTGLTQPPAKCTGEIGVSGRWRESQPVAAESRAMRPGAAVHVAPNDVGDQIGRFLDQHMAGLQHVMHMKTRRQVIGLGEGQHRDPRCPTPP